MEFLTGRYRWGNDEEYKFKISNYGQFWRSPGLVGSPGALGYFGLLSFMLMDYHDRYDKRKYFPTILVLFCFVRSVLLAFLVYIILRFVVRKKNLKRIVTFIKVGTPVLLLSFIYFFLREGKGVGSKSIFDIESIFMRIDNWFFNLNVDFNLLYGGAIGKLGAAVRGDGFAATVDSYWVYMLLSVGLIGVFLIIVFFIKKINGHNQLFFICLAFFLAGIFVTLTQSIPFLVLFPLCFLNREENTKNA
jgi:hypothetical protein